MPRRSGKGAPSRGAERFSQICDCRRLRRPHLFSRKRKDGGEKSAWGCGVLSASEFRREPGLQASFHSGVTLRAFDYAPPDTEVSGLQLVAVERLLSIEGALEIQMNFTFLRGPCRGGALLRPYRAHPKAPLPGELAPKATERLSLPGTTSPSRLRRATSPGRGGFGTALLYGFPS